METAPMMKAIPGTKMYSFKFYTDEMNELQAIAKNKRTTVSEMLRVAIRQIIADEAKKK
jgi:hypothetical protein